MADDAGRYRKMRFHRLAIAHDTDLLVDVVGHRHRPAQRDLLLAHAADDGILQIPEVIGDLGIDESGELHAALGKLGLELGAVEHVGCQRTLHVHEVELYVLKRK